MKAILLGLVEKFKQPSSWAGIGVIAGTVGLNMGDATIQAVSLIGAGVAGLIAVFLSEKGPTTPAA